MPKAVLKFDLSDSGDVLEFHRALLAGNMYCALWDVADAFRRHEKYGAEPLTREGFFEILESYKIDLD